MLPYDVKLTIVKYLFAKIFPPIYQVVYPMFYEKVSSKTRASHATSNSFFPQFSAEDAELYKDIENHADWPLPQVN